MPIADRSLPLAPLDRGRRKPSPIHTMRSLLSVRDVILTCVVLAVLALVLAVAKVRSGTLLSAPLPGPPLAMHGFHTAMYDGDRLAIRVSGDSLEVQNTKLFGPFSLGFAHSLVARNVTVEVFADRESGAEAGGNALSLDRVGALLAHEQPGVRLSHAEIGPLKVIEHSADGRTTVLLEADSCLASLWGDTFTCQQGTLRTDRTAVPFRELSYDGRSHRLQTR